MQYNYTCHERLLLLGLTAQMEREIKAKRRERKKSPPLKYESSYTRPCCKINSRRRERSSFLSLSHMIFTLRQNVFARHEYKQEQRSLTASTTNCILTLKTNASKYTHRYFGSHSLCKFQVIMLMMDFSSKKLLSFT